MMNLFEQLIELKKQVKGQIKGKVGEIGTTERFKYFFNDKSINYKVLKNIYIKFNNGNTTEIDIIVISEYGIFVIENKNYSGWIFGSFKNEYWTESYANGKKFKFYNPLRQNYTHINTLKQYIDKKYHNMIYSYVVFNNECELKKVPYSSEFIKVIKSNQIYDTLSESLKNKCITSDEVEQLYNNINQFANTSISEKINHVKRINKEYNS